MPLGLGLGLGLTFGGNLSSPFFSGASVDMDLVNSLFLGGTVANIFAVTRAGTATDLRPESPQGFAYNTYTANTKRINANGFLIETAGATNNLLNSTAPVTQTTASLGIATYTLWVNGSGTATVSAGTATITGAGAASQGTPLTFNVTVAGTVTVTVSGSLNQFQLETGSFGTSFIVTAGATASRSADSVTLAGAADTIIQSNIFTILLSMGGSLNTNPHVLRDATANYDLKLNGIPSQSGIVAVCNAQTLSGNMGSGTISSPLKFGFSIDNTSGGSLVANNGVVITNAAARWAGTTPNELLFSYQGYLKRLTLWNTKIGDPTLQNFTV